MAEEKSLFDRIGDVTSKIFKGIGNIVTAPFKIAAKGWGAIGHGVSTLLFGSDKTKQMEDAIRGTVEGAKENISAGVDKLADKGAEARNIAEQEQKSREEAWRNLQEEIQKDRERDFLEDHPDVREKLGQSIEEKSEDLAREKKYAELMPEGKLKDKVEKDIEEKSDKLEHMRDVYENPDGLSGKKPGDKQADLTKAAGLDAKGPQVNDVGKKLDDAGAMAKTDALSGPAMTAKDLSLSKAL